MSYIEPNLSDVLLFEYTEPLKKSCELRNEEIINFNYKKNNGDTEAITHKIKNSGDGNYSEIDDGGKEYSEEDLADRLYQANN